MNITRYRSIILKLAGLLLAAAVLGAACGAAGTSGRSESSGKAPASPVVYDPRVSYAPLVEKLSGSVVNIFTTQKIKVQGMFPFFNFGDRNDPFEQFFRPFRRQQEPREIEQHSLGSGFIISRNGQVVTNHHVVAKANEIKVRLADGSELDAEVVGSDERTDVALIQLKNAKDLKPAVIGSSDKLKVGDVVVAIGNPFGLGNTVTTGIVSAKGRVIGAGPYDDFIQTDASINPGNSGGPLFNLQGEVVGINTAIVRHGQGIGFAIPVDMANRVIEDLLSKGRVIRGWLGVGIQSMDDTMAGMFGLKESSGALINQVFEDSPAQKAGLKSGDVIVSVQGEKIKDARDLAATVATRKPGSEVKVKIIREGSKKTLKVIIGEMEDDIAAVKPAVSQKESNAAAKLGLQVRNPTAADRMPGERGVIVTRVDVSGPAAQMIRSGDIILEVNRNSVDSVDAFMKQMGRAGSGDDVLFKVRRKDSVMYIAVRVP